MRGCLSSASSPALENCSGNCMLCRSFKLGGGKPLAERKIQAVADGRPPPVAEVVRGKKQDDVPDPGGDTRTE